MNFKQVLSPGSTCAMLHSPSSIRVGAHLICSPSFYRLFFSFFDMLKPVLSHTLNSVFFPPLLCSFVVLLLHLTNFAISFSLFQLPFREIVLREALFFIFSLYPALPPILPLTSGCQSLSCSPDNAFCFSYPLWSLPFLFCPPLPLSSPVLFFSSLSFRRVIGALYLTR